MTHQLYVVVFIGFVFAPVLFFATIALLSTSGPGAQGAEVQQQKQLLDEQLLASKSLSPGKFVNKIKSAKRAGLWKCGDCRKQFTVTVGTLFERSHVALHKWFQAAYLLCASKKGMSAHQLHRVLGVRYQTAWFMAHRLREAMQDGFLMVEPMGGAGKVVEADETYFGNRAGSRVRPGPGHKYTILSLIERDGPVRSFSLGRATMHNVRDALVRNVRRDSVLHTDDSRLYDRVGREFAAHESVVHSQGEYVRGVVHINTLESYFSVFKRGMRGTYQHCAEKHLPRYLAEFDFRYNERAALGVSDMDRTMKALKGIEGKRLTYRHS